VHMAYTARMAIGPSSCTVIVGSLMESMTLPSVALYSSQCKKVALAGPSCVSMYVCDATWPLRKQRPSPGCNTVTSLSSFGAGCL
jgi:hypothetical protein